MVTHVLGKRAPTAKALRCSFCDKPLKDIRKLVQGPKNVAICDACIRLCMDIIAEDVNP